MARAAERRRGQLEKRFTTEGTEATETPMGIPEFNLIRSSPNKFSRSFHRRRAACFPHSSVFSVISVVNIFLAPGQPPAAAQATALRSLAGKDFPPLVRGSNTAPRDANKPAY